MKQYNVQAKVHITPFNRFLKFYVHTAMVHVMLCQLFALTLMTRLHELKNIRKKYISVWI